MNTVEPYTIDKIDVNKIVYHHSKNITSSKKFIYTKYREGASINRLVFQIPTMRLNDIIEDNDKCYQLEISLDGNKKAQIEQFQKLISRIEEKVTFDASINNEQWFGENDNVNFQKTISSKENTLKIKVIKGKENDVRIESSSKENKNIHDLEKGQDIKALLELYAVWISGNRFGILLKPIVIQYKEAINTIKYRLIEDSEDSEDDDAFVETENNVFIKNEEIFALADQETSAIQVPNMLEDEETSSEDFDIASKIFPLHLVNKST
jgi:hypothetical protein